MTNEEKNWEKMMNNTNKCKICHGRTQKPSKTCLMCKLTIKDLLTIEDKDNWHMKDVKTYLYENTNTD